MMEQKTLVLSYHCLRNLFRTQRTSYTPHVSTATFFSWHNLMSALMVLELRQVKQALRIECPVMKSAEIGFRLVT